MAVVQPADQARNTRAGRDRRPLSSSGASNSSCVQLGEDARLAALGGKGRGPYFKGFAQFEQFVDVVQGDIGDDDAAAACRRRQSFCGQPAQRLPERRARDAEAFGLLDFRQDGSRATAAIR